jgi:hypothetical protein
VANSTPHLPTITLKPSGADDTARITTALTTLSNTGGVLQLAAGTFSVSATIKAPVGVQIIGAGASSTFVHWTNASPPWCLIQGTYNFAIENLTIESVAYGCGIVSSLTGSLRGHIHIIGVNMVRVGTPSTASAIYYDNLPNGTSVVSGGKADALQLAGNDIVIAHCNISASARPLFLENATNAWIRDNVFQTYAQGWYCLSGSDGVIFENNTINGATSVTSNWGGGGGINTLSGGSCSKDVYFANNILENFLSGNGEAMTTDGFGGTYYGEISGVKELGTTGTLAKDVVAGAPNPVGCGLFVLTGTAQGEMRQVTSVSGQSVTVASPFNPAPDDGSLVVITPLQANYLIIGNKISNTGTAIQFYGASYNCVVVDNQCKDAGPSSNSAQYYGGEQPSWYIEWLNNTFSGRQTSYSYSVNAPCLSVYTNPQPADKPGALSLGTVFRGNLQSGATRLVISTEMGTNFPNYPFLQDVIVEQNTIPTGQLYVQSRTYGIFLGKNTFH